MFQNRGEAGRKLGERLRLMLKGEKNIVVFSIPRGGVVVGHYVAKSLGVKHQIICVKKIGHPENPEYAIGGVGQDGTTSVDKYVVEEEGISKEYIRKEAERLKQEIIKRLKNLGKKPTLPSLYGKIVVLVDDGVATGQTIKLSAEILRKKGAKKIVIAVPVGPAEVIDSLGRFADAVVCIETPDDLDAIGEFYEDFSQVEDEEVKRYLEDDI